MRDMVKRIERAEEALRTQSRFSPDCICFPKNERPSFGFPIEGKIAARVKCPIHGERFQAMFRLFVPKWRRESEQVRRKRLSPQFQKAWLASFPPELWLAEEEETEDGIYLRLKDGTRLLAQGNWRSNRVRTNAKSSLNQNSGLGTEDERETWGPAHS